MNVRSLSRTVLLSLILAAAPLVAAEGAGASTRKLTLFTIATRANRDVFVVATDDPELIAKCRAQLALPVVARDLHVDGALAWGHGGFNLGWRWHLDPDDWDLVEISTEVCDGVPGDPESDLPYWVGYVGRFCPWSSYVVAEGPPYPLADPARVAVGLEPVVSGLDEPVAVTGAGDGSGRLFVLEKAGRIRVVLDGRLEVRPFLDISDRVGAGGSEQGLLGLAFAPDFGTSGRLFVDYTDRSGDTVVSSFEVRDDSPAAADPTSEKKLLQISQPYGNDNGGNLLFGPDGMLWIGTGDGGSAGDPQGNAQNGTSLLGKILRIDVAGEPYGIPPDNPFRDDPRVRDEVWALGLRNPWRFSFDRFSGDLYIGDVGQSWQEVDYEPATDPGGRNYGWNIAEGMHCYQGASCSADGLTEPVTEYGHDQGCSVTGGFVYRGTRYPVLQGLYLFADSCSGRIWALTPGGRWGWSVAEVAETGGNAVSFGEDDNGELFAVDIAGGALYRVVGRPAVRSPRRPAGRVAPGREERGKRRIEPRHVEKVAFENGQVSSLAK